MRKEKISKMAGTSGGFLYSHARVRTRVCRFCQAFLMIFFSVMIISFNPLFISDTYATNVDVEIDAELQAEIDTLYNLDEKYNGPKPTQEDKEAFLREWEELQRAYEDAKANEQSLANRTLTALTVAATGIGGMELARGLAEQRADKEADQDMAAYIETMRCTYGDGKQVKAGPEEIELPGGNDATLMSLRNEYFALASDLKERKEALGMTPGIESETILDKAQMGLYDDENVGISSGAYASLYRAKALDSEEDKTKIEEEQSASKKRVIGGGVAAGAGAVGGIVGNGLINDAFDIKKNKTRSSQQEKSK